MSNRVLQGLQPDRVFYHFEELTRIPHGSGNTKQISDHLAAFAAARGLRYIQDEINNVIIFKDGTQGYETHPPVILQGHMDMVAQKTPDCPLDLTRDPLALRTDGVDVWAEGTTLGGDDGIAVACALALLEAENVPHPPLECVFTVDEETGMDGAVGLDTSVLRGRTFLNLDSENEGILTVSCAGGARAGICLPLERETAPGTAVELRLEGFLGGHSGVEIDKGRVNANKLMGRLLQRLLAKSPARLVSVDGGSVDNAIPNVCTAVLASPAPEEVLSEAEAIFAALQAELPAHDRGALRLGRSGAPACAMTAASAERVLALLEAVPCGVQKMSADIPGLVQTSLNLGILKTEAGSLTMTFSVRSSVNGEKQALLDRLQQLADRFGGSFRSSGSYPAWEYRRQSPLRETMVRVFARLYGRQPTVVSIHAGLECGLFSDRMPGLDCVSFGPDMKDIHTPKEKLNVASTARTWDYLLAVLREL